MALLRVEGACKAFGSTVLFRDVNLSLEEGMIIYLKGPNGSGKSTFLKALTGWLPLDQGTVRIGSSYVTELEAWQIEEKVPMADQNPCLEWSVPALEHLVDTVVLGHGRAWLLTRRHDIRRRVRDQMRPLLEALGLAEAIEAFTVELSYGQQKLLTLVRALRPLADGRPRVLLLDEPLAGLRPRLYKPILAAVRDRLDCGWAVLISEHLEAVHGLGEGLTLRFPVLKGCEG